MSSEGKNRQLLILSLLVLPCVLFWQSLSYDFVFDDFARIHQHHAVIESGGLFNSIKQAFLSSYAPGNLYRPVSTLSFQLNFSFGQLEPFSYHLLSLLLHLACVVVIFLLLSKIGVKLEIAFFTSFFFSIHPLVVEPTVNIAARSDLLATFFGLLFLYSYVSSKNVASLVFLFLALFSKESAIVFPILLVMVLGFQNKQTCLRELLKSHLKHFVFIGLVVFLYLSARFYVLGENVITAYSVYRVENPIGHLGLFERIYPSFVVLGSYIEDALLPLSLSGDYSLLEPDFRAYIFSGAGIFSAILFSLFFVFAVRTKDRYLAFGGLWFLISFLVTSNLFIPIGTIKADRLAYLPLVGLILVLCQLTFKVWNRYRVASRYLWIFFAALFCFYVSVANARIEIWKDQETFSKATILDSPKNPKILYMLGSHYLNVVKNQNEAEKYYRASYEIGDGNIYAARAMLFISTEKHDPYAAKFWAEQVLRFVAQDPEAIQVLTEAESFIEIQNR